jgi:hypothetical protein
MAPLVSSEPSSLLLSALSRVLLPEPGDPSSSVKRPCRHEELLWLSVRLYMARCQLHPHAGRTLHRQGFRFTGFRTPLTLSRMVCLRLPDDPRFRPHILNGACSMHRDPPVAIARSSWLTECTSFHPHRRSINM